MERKNVLAIGLALIIGVVIGAPVGYYIAPKPTTPATPTTLEFWAPFAGEESALWFWQNASDAFYNETGIEVKITFYTGSEYMTKLTSSFAAGVPPDLFTNKGGGELKGYVNENVVEDISDLLAEDWALAQIPESIRSSVTVNGKEYALPYELTVVGILINSLLFDQASVAVPSIETGWTWTEFIAACNALKVAGTIPVAMSGKEDWSLEFPTVYIQERLNGPDAFFDAYDRKISFFDQYNNTFDKVQEWVDGDYFQLGWETAGYMDAYQAFSTGQAAMWIQGTWAVGMCLGIEGLDLDAVPWPYFSEESNASVKDLVFGGGTFIGVAADSAYIDEAKAFLRFCSRPEWQIKMIQSIGTPIAQKIMLPPDIFDPTTEKFIDMVARASRLQGTYAYQVSPQFKGTMMDQFALIWALQTTPETAATTIETNAVELLGPVTG
ncbi:extracellular solute-binding protein [Candidatus Bathyarchaeota archaeon]|nr:extracellular solute-binding protein [Candidatus Bathyarchaeota archaeon]